MSNVPPLPPAAVDDQGTIVTDIPCRKCGYNLRTLSQSGLCPECGTPVGISVNGELLRYSDPAWLKKVSEGIRLILLGILVGIVFTLVRSMLSALSPLFQEALSLVGGAVGLLGGWFMTEPDPSGIGEDGKPNARKIVRLAIVGGFAGQVMRMLAFADVGMQVDLSLVVRVITLPLALVWIVGEFAKLTYLRNLAARIPDFKLEQSARRVRWGYTGSMAVMVVCASFALVLGVYVAIVGIAMAIAVVVYLVYIILAIVLMMQMRKAIAAQAQLASELWKQKGGEPL